MPLIVGISVVGVMDTAGSPLVGEDYDILALWQSKTRRHGRTLTFGLYESDGKGPPVVALIVKRSDIFRMSEGGQQHNGDAKNTQAK